MKCISLLNSRGELTSRSNLDVVTVNKLNASFDMDVNSVPEFYKTINELELTLDVIDISEPLEPKGVYEINVVPYHTLGFHESHRLSFLTEEFDKEELDALLEIPEIAEILEFDEGFAKLLNADILSEVNALNIIISYLERLYGFKFTVILLVSSDE